MPGNISDRQFCRMPTLNQAGLMARLRVSFNCQFVIGSQQPLGHLSCWQFVKRVHLANAAMPAHLPHAVTIRHYSSIPPLLHITSVCIHAFITVYVVGKLRSEPCRSFLQIYLCMLFYRVCLYFPDILPRGPYFLTTTRPEGNSLLRVKM